MRYRLLILSASVLSVVAVAAQESDADHYRLLQRQERQLQLRAESVAARLSQSRQRYTAEPTDSLAEAIGYLEYQYSSIVERSQAVRTEMSTLDSLMATLEAARLTQQTGVETEPIIVARPERQTFLSVMERYEADDKAVVAMAARYKALHNQAAEAVDRYRNGRNIAETDRAAADFAARTEEAKLTADSLADAWDNLSFEKLNAYFNLLDSLKLNDIKSDHTKRARQTELALDQIQGRYADADAAMLPLRRGDVIDLERRIAAYIGLTAEADSLAAVATQIVEDEFHLERLRQPARAAAEYGEAVIDSVWHYGSLKELTPIKVPEQGDVYSILLGSFKSQPKASVFRKAAPLFTERRADGQTYYYAGLYPTEKSASEGFERMLKAGFKEPQIVLWHNSLRRDDFTASLNVAKQAPQTTVYKVEISSSDATLPDEVMAIIRRDAPRKEISKIAAPDGKYTFTVGSFSQRGEADALARSILVYSDTKVIEIVL